jgi:sugar (pentulose or hexulose) kinase
MRGSTSNSAPAQLGCWKVAELLQRRAVGASSPTQRVLTYAEGVYIRGAGRGGKASMLWRSAVPFLLVVLSAVEAFVGNAAWKPVPSLCRKTSHELGASCKQQRRSTAVASTWWTPVRRSLSCQIANVNMAAETHSACGLGFDFGTSGARICVVDGISKEILHEASVPYSEQRADVWVAAMNTLLEGIPTAMRARITSVAVSGTSASVMLVDSRTGSVSRDARMYDYAASKEAVALASAAAPEGHTVRSATSTLAKVLQWHQESPILPEERVAHQADYLAAQLCGTGGRAGEGSPNAPRGGYTSDYNNALKIGYDVQALEYPAWMVEQLASLGLDAHALLPAVVRPGGMIGLVTDAASKRWGLAEGCRVVGGTTDSIAAFIAARASKPGQAVTSLGSTLAIKLLSTVPVDDSSYGVYSHRLGDMWLVGGASNVGCAVLRQEHFTGDELALLSARIDAQQDPPAAIRYYPLTKKGERFPVNDPNKEPLLEPQPGDRSEFLHGILFGIAQVEADAYALLAKMGATPVSEVRTAGGGSVNEVWTAMRERLIRVPVSRAEETEASFGVALLALDQAY